MTSLLQLPSPTQTFHLERGARVWLSDARLQILKARVEARNEPNFGAFLEIQAAADDNLNRSSSAPRHWYIPAFYENRIGHRNAKDALANDANGAYELALMARLTEREIYAQSAVRFIADWIETVETLSFEDDSTLSFCYHFPAFIFAADLLRDSPLWTDSHEARFCEFLREKALPLSTMERPNNWGNWGMVLVMATAVFLGDTALFQSAIERWKDFIATQIADEGHLPHEVTRNNGVGETGLWYSHFTLMPQTLAAEIAMQSGVDLFDYVSPNGHTLQKAFETLVPWTCAPSTFPFYTGADPKGQSGTQYISYWEILAARWPHPDAQKLLMILRPLSGGHCAPHLTFTHGEIAPNL